MKKVFREHSHGFTQAQEEKLAESASKRQDQKKIDDLFGNDNRIYLSVDEVYISSEQKDIEKFLKKQGYIVTDYKKGYATDQSGKQKYKIGKLLKDRPNILKRFVEDPMRSSFKPMIVISRDIQDIARMSTNRGWSSCMSADGLYFDRHVPKDIENGVLIAYLTSESDPEVNDPFARILIKPFKTCKIGAELLHQGDVHRNYFPVSSAFQRACGHLGKIFPPYRSNYIYLPETRVYGFHNDQFYAVVKDFLDKHVNDVKKGKYRMLPGLYPDSLPSTYIKR